MGTIAERRRDRKRRNKKRIVIACVLLCVIALFTIAGVLIHRSHSASQLETYGAGVYPEVYADLAQLSEYDANKDGYIITIESGDTATALAKRLNESGLIDDPKLFVKVAVTYGYDRQLQPGSYHVSWALSYKQILEALLGDNLTVKVNFPEYFGVRQTAERLAENGLIDRVEGFKKYTQKYWEQNRNSKKYPFLASITGEGRMNALEGYLFPATYDFEYNATKKDIVEKMLDTFSAYFTKKMMKKAAQLGMTTDEVVILASIVEREAANEYEMRRIAGVFINRLKINMRLQSCATVEYVFDNDDDPTTVHKDRLSSADTQIDSPYNTYQNYGLPVGPICNPGLKAIEAVLNYEKHDYYFFLVNGDKSEFSRTADEHAAKAQQYL